MIFQFDVDAGISKDSLDEFASAFAGSGFAFMVVEDNADSLVGPGEDPRDADPFAVEWARRAIELHERGGRYRVEAEVEDADLDFVDFEEAERLKVALQKLGGSYLEVRGPQPTGRGEVLPGMAELFEGSGKSINAEVVRDSDRYRAVVSPTAHEAGREAARRIDEVLRAPGLLLADAPRSAPAP